MPVTDLKSRTATPAPDRRAIDAALRAVVDPGDRFVVLHSSMVRLSPRRPVERWHALAAVQGLVRRGHTVALPAFTFSFCGGTPFDAARSASEVGVLADWALALEGARRTANPIYSFVVLGPRADEILACPSATTFGDDSPFALFERENARLVMLGCEWSECTQLHRYEEEAGVPYRTFETFEGAVETEAGRAVGRQAMFVRDRAIDAENDFHAAFDALGEAGAIASAPLGESRVAAVSCGALAATCRALLEANPLAFVAEPNVVAERLRRRARAQDNPPLHVNVLGSRNMAGLTRALTESLGAWIQDRRLSVFASEYGRLAQLALGDAATVAPPDAEALLSVFPDRLEDVLDVDALELAPVDGVDDRVDRYVETIRWVAERTDGLTVVHSFARLAPALPGHAEWNADSPIGDLIARANARLRAGLADRPTVRFFDPALCAVAGGPGGAAVTDPRLWRLGRFPFSNAFAQRLAERYTGMALAHLHRTARLLVVDLDDTLWHGILGEDGLEGISASGDFPGNAFEGFQRVLAHLSDIGVALAICSKNDEDAALAAIDTLDMPLSRRHFSAWRIGWTEKWRSVAELADELNLGLGHVGFVDDNPAERDKMRRHLPEVTVLDLPPDPSMYADALARWPAVCTLGVTDADRKRRESYSARAQVEHSRRRYTDIEDFYRSLGTQLYVAPFAPANAARITQLVNKTNQFNTTARRYDAEALAALARDPGHSVFAIGSADRYAEREWIGVLIVDWQGGPDGAPRLDLLALSCRILGRGIERGVLAAAVRLARSRGADRLYGEIVETERNTPARAVFADNGFDHAGAGWWRIGTGPAALPMPAWLDAHIENDDQGEAV